MAKILVPVDGSDCAEKTMAWAANTFDKSATEYYLLYVIRLLPDIPSESYEVEEAVAILNKAEETMKGYGCTVAKAEYATGDPSDMICQYAQEMKLDEVLIGSHGRKGLAKLLLGSVSSGVLERCPVPVFIYRNVEKNPAKAH